MNNAISSDPLFERIRLSRIISVLLIAVMLLFVGCDGNIDTPLKSNTSSIAGASSTDNSNSSKDSVFSSEEISSSENDKSADRNFVQQTVIDPLTGKYSYEYNNVNTAENKEIIPTGNTANLSNPLNGYFDDEADELRNKIVNAKNTEENYRITGRKFYVSANGDDSNSGLSPEEAIKSIDAVSGLGVAAGDAILFERGSVFRMYTTLLAEEGVIYGSYGMGDKPKIYASPMNFANAVWTPSRKKNVWQVDWVYSDAGSMIFEHGKEIGCRKTSMRNLEKNTDFFQDDSTKKMYLYCDKGNPANVYKSIEVGVRMSMILIAGGADDTVVIDNLCLKYGGVHGIVTNSKGQNIIVTNCELGYIGGCTTGGGGRYGNAIQFWNEGKNILIKNNWIYQTFDTAFSWQGYGGEGYKYEDITVANNLFEYNNTDIEFWGGDGAEVINFDLSDNILRFTCLGWGTRADDGGFRGYEGAISGSSTDNLKIDNITVKNNIFDCQGSRVIGWSIIPETKHTEIIVSGSKIYANSSYRLSSDTLRGFKNYNIDPNQMSALNAEEFIKAMKMFDLTADIKWF